MVKVISLSEEAYMKLKSLKGERSFSEVIVDIVDERKRKSLKSFYGVWEDRSDEWGKIKKKMHEDRKKAKLKEFKL